MENKYGCYACGKEVPTFKETLLIIAKFLQNPKTPKKILKFFQVLKKIGNFFNKKISQLFFLRKSFARKKFPKDFLYKIFLSISFIKGVP